MKVVLSIAGSDSSGGAGIQADIKTIIANGCFAETAITALTAQNTLGVRDIMNVTSEFLENELDAIFEDMVHESGLASVLEVENGAAQPDEVPED